MSSSLTPIFLILLLFAASDFASQSFAHSSCHGVLRRLGLLSRRLRGRLIGSRCSILCSLRILSRCFLSGWFLCFLLFGGSLLLGLLSLGSFGLLPCLLSSLFLFLALLLGLSRSSLFLLALTLGLLFLLANPLCLSRGSLLFLLTLPLSLLFL